MERLDFDLLDKHLSDPSGLTRLLKAHLWLELCVDRALVIHLRRPDKLDISRMTFASKVNYCDALAAFGEHEVGALRTVNRVRNRAAHELGADLTAKEFRAIEDGVQGHARHLMDQLKLEKPSTDDLEIHAERFARVMMMLIHTLEMTNVRARWEKENKDAYEAYMLVCAIQDRRGNLDFAEEARIRKEVNLPPLPMSTDAWKNFPELERRAEEHRDDRGPWRLGKEGLREREIDDETTRR
jgi:hypothetical protein